MCRYYRKKLHVYHLWEFKGLDYLFMHVILIVNVMNVIGREEGGK